MDSNTQDTEESITGDIAGDIDKSNINGSESENDAEIQTANVELVSDPNSTLRKNKSSGSVSTKDDTLITDWNAAVSSLPAQPPSSEQQGNTATATNNPLEEEQTSSEESVSATNNPRDSVSEASAESNNAENNNTVSENIKGTPSQSNWITANDYAIQMLAMKDESVLKAFLRENGLVEHTRIYKTFRYGGAWFVVVNKNIYASLSQAQQARTDLPEYPGKQNAFIKRGNQILSEMGKAQN